MVNATVKTRQIGDIQADGTIYAGRSPTNGKPMFAAPTDSPTRLTFNEAAAYAKKLQGNFVVPNAAEMQVLAAAKLTRAFRDTFKASDEDSYWTSETCSSLYGEEVRLRDGYKDAAFNQEPHFVRPVRYGL